MIVIPDVAVEFMGAFSGVLAISIALYLQFVPKYQYTKPYILGMFIFGAFLVTVHLEPILNGTGYFDVVRLVLYASIIVLELLVFYDLYDGDPELIERVRSLKRHNE